MEATRPLLLLLNEVADAGLRPLYCFKKIGKGGMRSIYLFDANQVVSLFSLFLSPASFVLRRTGGARYKQGTHLGQRQPPSRRTEHWVVKLKERGKMRKAQEERVRSEEGGERVLLSSIFFS